MNISNISVRKLGPVVAALLFVSWIGGAALAVSSDDALTLLKEGNARFAAGSPLHPHSGPERVTHTAEGQSPFAAILTCSDSRVPPEMIFDRGIGDLFVVRDAGNVVDPLVTGSIEYAVGHLNVPRIVVMGHTSCGAVAAAVSGGHAEGSISATLDKIEPSVRSTEHADPELKGQQLVDATSRANVLHSIDELLSHSSQLRDALRKGSIRIEGALYDVTSGQIEWLGSRSHQ